MDKEEGLEYLSLSDSAWYDVDVATSRVVRAQTEEKGPVYALKLAWKGDDDQQSGCRYLDSPKDLCRLEDLDLRLRRQSQPVQDEQCRSVRPGMQVVALCKHANGQRKYYTATIKAARHRDHPPAEDCCICSFDVVYQPDRSANGGQVAMPPHEASLGLEDLCFPGGPAKGHPAVEGWRSQLAQLAKGGGNQQAAKQQQQQQQQEAKPAHFPLAPRRVAPVSSGSPKQAARGGTRTPPRSARLGARENGDAASAGAAAAEADTVAGGGEAACQQEPPAAPCPRKAPLKVRLPRAPNGTAAAAAGAACSDGGGAAAAAGSGSTGQPAAAAAPAPTGVREEVAGAAAAAGSSDEDAEGAAPQAAPHAPRALPAGLSVTGGLLKGPAPELNTALQAALDGVRGSAEVVSEAPGGQASEAAAGHEPAGSAGPGPEQDPSPRVKREREEDEQQQDQAERPRPAVKHEPHWEQAQRRSEERLWDEAARGGGREVGGPGMGATLTSPFLLHQNGAAAGASDGAGHHAHAEAAARPPVAAAGASFSAPSASRSLSQQQQQQPLPSQLVDLVAGPDGLPDLLTAPQRASVARMACAPVRWLDAGPFGLPDRWVCYEKQRTSGATGRLGHKDRYFLSPEGKVCRSHTQALAHLAALAPGARPAPPPRPAAFAAAHEAAGGGGGEGRPVRKRARREPSAWLLDSDDSNATQEPEPEPRDEDEGDDWVPSGDDDGNESDEMGRAPPSLLARRTAAAAAGAGAAGAGGMQAAVAAAAAARPAGRIKLKARQPLGGLGFGGPLAASGNSAHLGTGHFALPQQLQQQQQQPPQLHTQHEALPQQQQRQSHQQPQQQGQQAAPAAAAAAAAVAERSRADSEEEAAFSDAEDLSMQFSLPLTLRDVLRLAHLYSDGAVDLGAGARRALVDGVAEAMPELQVRLGEARADAALATSAVLLEAPHLMHWGRRVLTDAGRASLLARADGAARARHQQQQQQQQQRRPAHSARQAASGAATDGLTEGQQQGSAPACDQQQQERFAAAPEQAREQQQERQQQEVQQQQERQQEQQQQEQQERHGLKEQLHRDHVAANEHESPAPTQCLREPAQQEQEQRRQEQQQRQGPQQQQQHQQVVHMQVPPAALPSSGPLPPVAPVH